MADKIDPGLIQQYLSLICDKIAQSPILANRGFENIIKLAPSGRSPIFDAAQSNSIRHTEHQIMSLQPVSTAGAATELFGNGKDNNPESINFKYSIHNNIVLELSDGFYYFNIDEVNNSNDAAHRFLIHKLEVKNIAKDSFTAKSNYVVTFDIVFKYFDDLLAEHITIKKIGEETTTRKIPLMFILYKGFNPAGINLPIYDQQLRDSNGIYLNQYLYLDDKVKFSKTRSDLADEIHRTHHLTFYKHEFEVFKSQDPILIDYENSLKITYVSYEADTVPKIFRSKGTPSTVDNLYGLIDNKKLINAINETKNINDEILKTTTLKGCVDLTKQDAGQKKEQKNKYEEDIKALNTQAQNIKESIDRELISKILSGCTIYKFTITQDELGIHKNDRDWRNLLPALGWTAVAAAGVFAIGVSGGLAAGVAATILGTAGLGAVMTGASSGVQSLVSYFKTTYNQTTPAAQTIRTNAEGKNIQRDTESADQIQKLQQEINYYEQAVKRAEEADKARLINITDSQTTRVKKDILKNARKALEDAKNIPEKTEDENEITIKFILFGDLIKLLALTQNGEQHSKIKIISGGKLIPQDADGLTNAYVNICDMPISLPSLWQFLENQISKKENRHFQYHSEMFLRDAYDILLKGALRSADGMLDEQYKHYIPGNLHMNAGVHFAGTEYDRLVSDLDILKEENVVNFKQNLVKSKMLPQKISAGTSSELLRKVYSIGTIEEARYYDYYEQYKNWADSKGKQFYRRNVASETFQQYIIENFYIPCTLIRYSANNETILRKKNMNFGRIDNPNITVGAILDGKPIFRMPYSFSSEFKPYISFFLDIGSLIFIAPPESREEKYTNTFGFGGLYVIKESTFVYNFQRLANGAPTLPNEESYVSLGGYLISHGDSVKANNNIVSRDDEFRKNCEAATLVNKAPAAGQ
jgi:hypothetical protein